MVSSGRANYWQVEIELLTVCSEANRQNVKGDLDLDVDKHEKWFKINPPGRFRESGIYEESDLPTAVREHEIMVVNEEQCAMLWEAVAFIDQVCAKAKVPIDTDAEKIRYIKKVIPGC